MSVTIVSRVNYLPVNGDMAFVPAMRRVMVGDWTSPQDERVYEGNAHAEAARVWIETCLDVLEADQCVACEVENGAAIMVTIRVGAS